MTNKELKDIKDRALKSSEKWEGTANVPFYVHLKRPRMSLSKHDSEKYNDINFLHYDDGVFIASARKDMLDLIAEIEKLKTETNRNKGC